MVLLGDVRELEVEAEGSEHGRLPLERQGADGGGELRARARLTHRPGSPRERADALLVREQILPFLLDEDAAEDVAEQADIAPKRSFWGSAQGRVTAPSLADETSAAYFARTPVS